MQPVKFSPPKAKLGRGKKKNLFKKYNWSSTVFNRGQLEFFDLKERKINNHRRAYRKKHS
jgi:hypothetical protein